MTEASYQQARKLMQQLNYLRSEITKAKGTVAMWTRMEMSYREQLKEGQANGAHKKLLKAMEVLQEKRRMFVAIQFPPSDLPAEMATAKLCRVCHDLINNDQEYCLTCYDNQNIPKYDFKDPNNKGFSE